MKFQVLNVFGGAENARLENDGLENGRTDCSSRPQPLAARRFAASP